ncbi:MAG: tyrosine-type recombinase/integrase [Bacteroidetes bacterium]|nr:tyrosine-type recombinase/integrase [Bacteroidota bacterium]
MGLYLCKTWPGAYTPCAFKRKKERSGLCLCWSEDRNRIFPTFNHVNFYLQLFSNALRTSPHILRHSFATHLLNNGANLMAIKEILGHTSLSATQVYTRNSFEKLKQVHLLHPRK